MSMTETTRNVVRVGAAVITPGLAALITQFTSAGTAYALHCADWTVRGEGTGSSRSNCCSAAEADAESKCYGSCCKMGSCDAYCVVGDYVCPVCGVSANPWEGDGETCTNYCGPGGPGY